MSIEPGPTAFTRIPCGANANAAAFVSWFIPPFDAQYAGMLEMATLALIDDIFTIAPFILCSFIDCAARCVATNGPFKFTLITLSKSSKL